MQQNPVPGGKRDGEAWRSFCDPGTERKAVIELPSGLPSFV
jgi:hypothetical protein